MAYRKAKKDEPKTTWYPVSVDSRDKEGKIVKQGFRAKFLIPSQTEINDLIGPDAENVNDEKIIEKVLLGWDEIQDENGDPLEFNPQNVAEIMEEFPTRPTTVRAWLTLVGKLGQRKN